LVYAKFVAEKPFTRERNDVEKRRNRRQEGKVIRVQRRHVESNSIYTGETKC